MALVGGIQAGAIADTFRERAKDARAQQQLDIQQGQLDLNRERLGFDRSKMQAAAEKDRKAQVKAVKEGVAATIEAIRQGINKGIPPEKLAGLQKMAGMQIDALNALNEPAAGAQLRKILETTVATPSAAGNVAATEGQSAAVKSVAQSEALQRGGVSPAASAKAAGIGEPEPKTPQPQNFVNPKTGERTFVDLTAPGAAEEIADLKNKGFIEFGASVQAATIGGLGVTGETPKSVGEVRDRLRSTTASMEELKTTLAAFEKTPQAGGILGRMIEKGGGLLQQFDEVLGTDLSGTVGIDMKAVTEARTQARVTTSQMLTTITKEESRFTDEERKRAEQALQTLELTASPQQIKTALSTAIAIMERSEVRDLDRLRLAAKADLSTDEGIDQFGAVLLDNGYTRDQAISAITRLRKRLGFGNL